MTYSATSDSMSGPLRPSRWKRIKFIFRMMMLVLPLGFFVLTRSNPDLHMTMVTKAAGFLQPYLGNEGPESTTMAQRFSDKVKVNRFSSSTQGGAFGGGSGNARANAQEQADGVSRLLKAFNVGG